MEPAGCLEQMRDDHRRVIERLAQLAPEPGTAAAHPAPPDVPRLREFVAFLARQFDVHMGAEDRILFPILADLLPAMTESLAPLRAEHEELRSMLAALTAQLDAPAGEFRDQQIAIQVADLADLLRIHTRKEERLVFELAERVLRPGELERLVAERTTGSRARLPESGSPNERIS